jgi:6,7-dimethyl-8-ribityllumazine synthase
MRTHEGQLDARGKRFAVVASRFNDFIVDSLIRGATSTLERLGAHPDAIEVFRVPGAFEIPAVAARAARSGRFHAVVCLGCVIRGSTPHFDYVAGECSRGIARVAAESRVPVIYGVLTTDTIEQAIERAGTKAGNRGADAAVAAVEMADLYARLDRERPNGS